MEGVLRTAISPMLALEFSVGFFFRLGFLQCGRSERFRDSEYCAPGSHLAPCTQIPADGKK
jgi:hypothetical protein